MFGSSGSRRGWHLAVQKDGDVGGRVVIWERALCMLQGHRNALELGRDIGGDPGACVAVGLRRFLGVSVD